MLSLYCHQLCFINRVLKNPPFRSPGLVPKFLTHESPKADRYSPTADRKQGIFSATQNLPDNKQTKHVISWAEVLWKSHSWKPFEFSFLREKWQPKVANQPSVWNANLLVHWCKKSLNNRGSFPTRYWSKNSRNEILLDNYHCHNNKYCFVCQKYWMVNLLRIKSFSISVLVFYKTA